MSRLMGAHPSPPWLSIFIAFLDILIFWLSRKRCRPYTSARISIAHGCIKMSIINGVVCCFHMFVGHLGFLGTTNFANKNKKKGK